MFKYTKIGATIGPSCATEEIIERMVRAGMNFARLNFAHGTYEDHTKLIERLRAVEERTGQPLAILQDLQGPRIRIGTLPEEGIAITVGKKIVLNTALTEYAKGGDIPVDHHNLHEFLKAGERILIDDGRVELLIDAVDGTKITATVREGVKIASHKGINLPDSTLHIPALSDKDKSDLRFGVKMGVDMVGLSFVSTATDILDIKFLIKEIAKEEGIPPQPIFVVAKIERHEAVDNLKEILAVADGIMVARGDLGLELPAAEVPLMQKTIIDEANAAAKPVIVATQMLNSMQNSRRPTRAEVSDVANAVIDHADGLLLTNETASGEFPVEAVQTMTDIIVATEKSAYDDAPLPAPHKGRKATPLDTAITEVTRLLAEEVNAKLILAASLSGETGRLISRVRPPVPVLVATSTPITWRQLNVSWGVRPFILLPCQSVEELVERSINYIREHKIAKSGDTMIIVAGEPVGQVGNLNLVEVRTIS